MSIESKDMSDKNSICEEDDFSEINGLTEELKYLAELTPDDLLSKISMMCMEGLRYEADICKETQLYSIHLALETFFALKEGIGEKIKQL